MLITIDGVIMNKEIRW